MSRTICSSLQLRVKAALVKYNLLEKSYFETFNPIWMTDDKWVGKKEKGKTSQIVFSNYHINKIKERNTIKRVTKIIKISKRSSLAMSQSIEKISLGSNMITENKINDN